MMPVSAPLKRAVTAPAVLTWPRRGRRPAFAAGRVGPRRPRGRRQPRPDGSAAWRGRAAAQAAPAPQRGVRSGASPARSSRMSAPGAASTVATFRSSWTTWCPCPRAAQTTSATRNGCARHVTRPRHKPRPSAAANAASDLVDGRRVCTRRMCCSGREKFARRCMTLRCPAWMRDSKAPCDGDVCAGQRVADAGNTYSAAYAQLEPWGGTPDTATRATAGLSVNLSNGSCANFWRTQTRTISSRAEHQKFARRSRS
ncbi:Mycobacterium terramassiliense ORFan [Mycobacterium terramassiliense]|uniref:Mycobacterium terramassiliense ORFan n=1 Tax=Mycobacterium terramassiliense TaxID=1841859 RepID=A0A2U3N6M6_9MYCO|nr:Mycobacterium terramassiliense ORFan [Mycobacterium terramassiliense]